MAITQQAEEYLTPTAKIEAEAEVVKEKTAEIAHERLEAAKDNLKELMKHGPEAKDALKRAFSATVGALKAARGGNYGALKAAMRELDEEHAKIGSALKSAGVSDHVAAEARAAIGDAHASSKTVDAAAARVTRGGLSQDKRDRAVSALREHAGVLRDAESRGELVSTPSSAFEHAAGLIENGAHPRDVMRGKHGEVHPDVAASLKAEGFGKKDRGERLAKWAGKSAATQAAEKASKDKPEKSKLAKWADKGSKSGSSGWDEDAHPRDEKTGEFVDA